MLVSRALTSSAEASAANVRASDVAVVPITYPSLSATSAAFHLNTEQNVAFSLACAPLLQHFLDLAVGDDDVATTQARALLAELTTTSTTPLICTRTDSLQLAKCSLTKCNHTNSTEPNCHLLRCTTPQPDTGGGARHTE